MRAKTNEGNEVPVPVTKVSPPIIVRAQDQGGPRRNERVVRQPERFIGLGEVPEDPETDPSNYNKAIQDKDATLWQKSMNTEMESMYSNQVWLLVDSPNGSKPMVTSGYIREKEG